MTGRYIRQQLLLTAQALPLICISSCPSAAFGRISSDIVSQRLLPVPSMSQSIEDPKGGMRQFYESLMRTEQDEPMGITRIVHYGDSHVAADILTGALRSKFQIDFGDGGPGFVLAGRPWQWYSPHRVKTSSSAGWVTEGVQLPHRRDCRLGLAGISVSTLRAGSWIHFEAESRRFEFYLLGQPGGGVVNVRLDGSTVREVSLASEAAEPVYIEVVAGDHGLHSVELRTMSDGLVRVFGVVVEHDRAGVTYDALGINGARAGRLLWWDWHVLADNLDRRAPNMIVVAYGSNEVGDSDLDLAEYTRSFSFLLDRLRRAVPQASLLVISPPDRARRSNGRWQSVSRLPALVAAQRRAALDTGAAFWDLFRAMGGPGSIERWATQKRPLARSDRVHLTRAGYQMVAGMLYTELMRDYMWSVMRELRIADWKSSFARSPQSAIRNPQFPDP